MSSQDSAPHSVDLTALSESSFEQNVLDQDMTHLVLFWASWSKDCMALLHDITQMLDNDAAHTETINLGSVDIEHNAMLSIQYNIRTLPTLMVFHKGRIHTSHEGFLSTHQLETLFAEVHELGQEP